MLLLNKTWAKHSISVLNLSTMLDVVQVVAPDDDGSPQTANHCTGLEVT